MISQLYFTSTVSLECSSESVFQRNYVENKSEPGYQPQTTSTSDY
jgi:hypothetical protein